jgi:hypothetical protein
MSEAQLLGQEKLTCLTLCIWWKRLMPFFSVGEALSDSTLPEA